MIASLDHLVLTVRDIDALAAWYERVCGMRQETFAGGDDSVRTALTFGSQKINRHQAGHEFAPHAAVPTPGSGDLCFLVKVAIADVQQYLADCGVAIDKGPVHRTGATGSLVSVYVRDPDGDLVELSEHR